MNTSADTVKNVVEKLCDFQCEATPNTFNEVFGEVCGEHLWKKFVGYKHNLILLYSVLDKENGERLSNHISTM